MTISSTNQDQIVEEARELLSVGIPKGEIVAHLRSEFEISRSSAYAKASQAESYEHAEAVDARDASQDDIQSILKMTRRLMTAAYKQQDSAAFVRLATSFQKTSALVGLLPQDPGTETAWYLRMCDEANQDPTE